MVKTNQDDGPWVFGTILRFRPSRFKKQLEKYRDGGRRIPCSLNGIPVYDETTQVRIGHYSCSRYGNKLSHRKGEIAALRDVTYQDALPLQGLLESFLRRPMRLLGDIDSTAGLGAACCTCAGAGATCDSEAAAQGMYVAAAAAAAPRA